jgi:phosphatidylserine/phosphatidylglycerophosphate/cardiolipin synthase-like enzyme
MAKFINTRQGVAEIDNLFRSAGENLLLVSAYLKLPKDFRELLTLRDNSKKKTTLIFRDQKLAPDEISAMQSLQFVTLRCNANVHAKCYAGDHKMIITSMNLYEFSINNNKEMGVLIDRNDPADAQLFRDAMAGIDIILQTSQPFTFPGQKSAAGTSAFAPKPKIGPGHSGGYCIRTGVPIPYNLEKPLSAEAYRKWNEYGDRGYPEKFCHFSGEPSKGETSFDKPVLQKNWKKAQEAHGRQVH